MTNSFEIKEQLTILNTVLSEFIDIHDVLFQQRLGEGVAYASLLERLDTILVITTETDRTLSNLLDKNSFVFKYINSLLLAQKQLRLIINNLMRKADGIKYGFFAYWRDMRSYKLLQKSYLNYGNQLNSLYRSLV